MRESKNMLAGYLAAKGVETAVNRFRQKRRDRQTRLTSTRSSAIENARQAARQPYIGADPWAVRLEKRIDDMIKEHGKDPDELKKIMDKIRKYDDLAFPADAYYAERDGSRRIAGSYFKDGLPRQLDLDLDDPDNMVVFRRN